MQFPQLHALHLPCVFERLIPGKLHPDGRRYLPLIVVRLLANTSPGEAIAVTPPNMLLGVVDRHHVVDQGLVGRTGVARLVCALSVVRLQQSPYRCGLLTERSTNDYVAAAPTVLGQIRAVLAWESEHAHLPYQTLYTELLLDIGAGVIGVRTSTTADDLGATIGKTRLEARDWIELTRSRIDILSFDVSA